MAAPIRTTPPGRGPSRRRPRDRKQQILRVGAQMFWKVGFHQTSVADIAETVGIVPSALYRHFRNKRELLIAIMNDVLDTYTDRTAAASTAEEMIDILLATSIERREFGVLWTREGGHLPPAEQEHLREKLRGIRAHLVALANPDGKAQPEDELRAWAALAIVDSLSFHHLPVQQDDIALLRQSAQSIFAFRFGERATATAAPETTRDPISPVSRREALLSAAVRLFDQRGYPSVSLTDIGRAAGVTGPVIYAHFDSKAALLVAALNRGSEAVWLHLHHALRSTSEPREALRLVAGGYARFALEHSDIVGVMISEMINLPDDRQEHFRRVQRDFANEWVALLRRTAPDLSLNTARIRVHAALSLCNSLSRLRHLRTLPSRGDDVGHLACTILGIDGPGPGA